MTPLHVLGIILFVLAWTLSSGLPKDENGKVSFRHDDPGAPSLLRLLAIVVSWGLLMLTVIILVIWDFVLPAMRG